jgi:hypothetical protein
MRLFERTLAKLDLSDNKLGGEGDYGLHEQFELEHLKALSSLLSLNLSSNNIRGLHFL